MSVLPRDRDNVMSETKILHVLPYEQADHRRDVLLCGRQWSTKQQNHGNPRHHWDRLSTFLWRVGIAHKFIVCQACLDAITPLDFLAHTDL